MGMAEAFEATKMTCSSITSPHHPSQMILPTEMKTCANWLRDF